MINEAPEAWQYGPVIRTLYHKLKSHGMSPINKELDSSESINDNEKIEPLLHAVWNVYKDISALKLSSMTHMEGTPWSSTPRNSFISDSLIQTYYKTLMDDNKMGTVEHGH